MCYEPRLQQLQCEEHANYSKKVSVISELGGRNMGSADLSFSSASSLPSILECSSLGKAFRFSISEIELRMPGARANSYTLVVSTSRANTNWIPPRWTTKKRSGWGSKKKEGGLRWARFCIVESWARLRCVTSSYNEEKNNIQDE